MAEELDVELAVLARRSSHAADALALVRVVLAAGQVAQVEGAQPRARGRELGVGVGDQRLDARVRDLAVLDTGVEVQRHHAATDHRGEPQAGIATGVHRGHGLVEGGQGGGVGGRSLLAVAGRTTGVERHLARLGLVGLLHQAPHQPLTAVFQYLGDVGRGEAHAAPPIKAAKMRARAMTT